MSSAREMAEERVRYARDLVDMWERRVRPVSVRELVDAVKSLSVAMESLLAAEPAKGAETLRPVLSVYGMHDTCDLCQRAIPDGCYAVFCGGCEDKLRAAFDGPPPVPIDPPAPPARDEVREAAERLEDDLKYVSPARVEAEHGSDVADAIRSAEALLAALRGGAKGGGR